MQRMHVVMYIVYDASVVIYCVQQHWQYTCLLSIYFHGEKIKEFLCIYEHLVAINIARVFEMTSHKIKKWVLLIICCRKLRTFYTWVGDMVLDTMNTCTTMQRYYAVYILSLIHI